MKVAIRADASSIIGTGHVVRCRTLAIELRRRGAEVRFVCRAHEGNLIELLRDGGFDVAVLPAIEPDGGRQDRNDDYAAWLGVEQTEDASEVIDVLSAWHPSWMIVDHYGIDRIWEGALRSHVDKLLVIDDLENRFHDCDALLDQNYAIDFESRYNDRVSPGARLLLGPRYALLSPEYADRSDSLQERDGKVRSVLIFMGGTDAGDATGLALEAMMSPGLDEIALDIVVGANYPHRSSLAQKVAARGRATVRGPLPTLVDAMAKADLAIGAGGATSWERLCLGLPSVIISVAENQRPASEALARAGLTVYAGDLADLDVAALVALLQGLVADPDKLRSMSETGKSLVDGYGATRVADVVSGEG